MVNPKRIGQRVTLKYFLIQLFLLILTPIIIGLVLHFVFYWPVIIGGSKESFTGSYWVGFIVTVFIGSILAYVIGGWTGKLILEKSKSAYLISVLTLGIINIVIQSSEMIPVISAIL